MCSANNWGRISPCSPGMSNPENSHGGLNGDAALFRLALFWPLPTRSCLPPGVNSIIAEFRKRRPFACRLAGPKRRGYNRFLRQDASTAGCEYGWRDPISLGDAMALIQFTKNHSDHSTDKGYQFEFFCDRCGNGFMSEFKPSMAGLATGALRAAGDIFGGIFGRASHGTYEIERVVRGPGHDNAFPRSCPGSQAELPAVSQVRRMGMLYRCAGTTSAGSATNARPTSKPSSRRHRRRRRSSSCGKRSASRT